MGQAKQKGSFEQRKEAAVILKDKRNEQVKLDVDNFSEFEARQEQFKSRIVDYVFNQALRTNINNPIYQALLRIDFTQIQNVGQETNSLRLGK